MSIVKDRESYMTQSHKTAMGTLPRTHANCKLHTKVMRPGKTAKDRALSGH